MVEGGARAGRLAAAAGRGQLRQRLLRRHPRHRRRPRRPVAAGRQRRRDAPGREDGRVPRASAPPRWSAWCSPRPPPGGWSGVGLLCILAAWFYTGGKQPYGYLGLGEVMVFVFFGLVAVLGTTYVQTETFELPALYAAIGVGRLRLRDPGRQQPARHPHRPRSPGSAPSPSRSATSAPASSTGSSSASPLVALVGCRAHHHLVGPARPGGRTCHPRARSPWSLADRPPGPT